MSEKIFGFYTSDVAELGFFVTKIRLNKDSTFEYGFSGDLIHQTGKGIFEINNKNEVLLKFEKKNEKEKTRLTSDFRLFFEDSADFLP